MPRPNALLYRVLSSRRGSVLILVVALLLLLAVIGTAFISGTRTDRYASAQHTTNSQVDLVVQGLQGLVNSAVVGKLYDPTVAGSAGYRLLSNSESQYAYSSYESPLTDLYLAPRVPEVLTPGSPASAANAPYWSSLSFPSFSRGTASATPYFAIDCPDGTTAVLAWNYDQTQQTKYIKGDIVVYQLAGAQYPSFYTPTATAMDVPTSSDWTLIGTSPKSFAALGKSIYWFYPTYATLNGQSLPAFTILNNLNADYVVPRKVPLGGLAYSATPVLIIAADADGDGIADSIPQRFPFDQVDGITYFAAERVIDDSSAINVNTALNSYNDYSMSSSAAVDALGRTLTASPNNQQNLGVFPSHLGLMQVLGDYNTGTFSSPQATTRFLQVPWNTNSGAPLNLNFYPSGSSTNPPYTYDDSLNPYPPLPATAARMDFEFTTKGDELNTQLDRRLAYPGFRTATLRFEPYTISDELPLAYRFCIENQSVTPNTLESTLPASLASTSEFPTTGNASQQIVPYSLSANSSINWFNYNFNYTQGGGLPVRPLLVTSNAVSDFVSKHMIPLTAVPATHGVINPLMLPYDQPVVYPTSPSNGAGLIASTQTQPLFVLQSSALGQNLCFESISASVTTPPVTGTTIDSTDWRYVPWTETPTKANINTADFATLFRAFANVMQDNPDSIPPLPGGTATIPYTAAGWGMFRSPSHLATGAMTSGEMLQLRAALAAVNAIAMRGDDDQNVVSKTVPIFSDAAHTALAYTAQVFGVVKQPFITAAVANYDGTTSTQVSIEIFNPTDSVINIGNWVLASISPTATPPPTPPISTPIYTQLVQVPVGVMIQPQQGIIFQGAPAANTVPGTSEAVPPVVAPIVATGLENVATPGAEMEVVLLRPRAANGTYSISSQFDNTYNEAAGLGPQMSNLMPVDSLDFTNIFTAQKGTPGTYQRVYERAHSVSAGGYDWDESYPGDYTIPAGAGLGRQIGWGAVQSAPVPVQVGFVSSDGVTEPVNGLNPMLYHPIQLATTGWVGPNPIVAGLNHFPFGAFARNGDMLKIPFIGAYQLIAPGSAANVVAASNPITADAAMARCNIASIISSNRLDPSYMPPAATPAQDEAIGRFCPLASLNPKQTNYTSTTAVSNDPYGWASKIFDYLDVQVANDDFLPNVDPGLAFTGNFVYPTGSVAAVATAVPDAVASNSNGTAEQTLGHQGLININTASAFVLAALPGVTQAMANQIVADRETNGPFQSIFDLNRVGFLPTNTPSFAGGYAVSDGRVFQTGGGQMTLYNPATTTTTNKSDDDLQTDVANDPGSFFGDFSPLNSTGKGASVAGMTDGVRCDFEEMTLMINRISNLITTRSDMFTVYLDVQGWRNVGSVSPVLVSERRVAYKLDRNSATQSNPTAVTYPIPQN